MEFYRGVVRSYDSGTHTATVLLIGSLASVVVGIPVAQQVGPESMVVGAACGVLFSRGGASGVVVCTVDGGPGAWVTSALIVDGTVTPADLSFSPCTPGGALLSTTTGLTLTTTATTFDTLSKAITVAAGKTIRVLAVANVEFECTAYTSYTLAVLEVYNGGAAAGAAQSLRMNAVSTRGSVTVAVVVDLTASATMYAKVRKAPDASTVVAQRGNLAVLWWEDT